VKPIEAVGITTGPHKRVSWCKNCQGPIYSGEPFDIVAVTSQGIRSIKAKHKDGNCNAPKQA
jgi:hypothetical protein